MKGKNPVMSFAPYELRRFIYPLTLAVIVCLSIIIAEGIFASPAPDGFMILYGAAGITHIAILNRVTARSPHVQNYTNWVGAGISGVGLGFLLYILPDHLHELFHIMTVLGIVGVATLSGRMRAYVTFLGALAVSLPFYMAERTIVESLLEYLTPFMISAILVEAITRIENTTQQHIHRLETINKVSRQIMMSLDTEQTISLLNATMQDALDADTYYVGIVKDGEIQLDLFYDDGEYFNGTRVPLDGTLSGWVVKNQRELFLPDLRETVELEGVGNFIIGKDKTSLSWMGVPLKAENVSGVIALASYTPNTFDKADMELLSNLAQQVTLALDNTIRHAQVEEQARLDSLTGVYNHGHFLKILAEQSAKSSASNTPLSLIMLDIDYFKQYNDTYGHLVGDRILNTLCAAIKSHIKQADAVGRWGGEEFIISLAGATGEQAIRVAKRIGDTLSSLRVENREQKTVPVPTVSQGIAVFPSEADEIYRLIDLADRRLYVAKERGRNQIEPREGYWNNP